MIILSFLGIEYSLPLHRRAGLKTIEVLQCAGDFFRSMHRSYNYYYVQPSATNPLLINAAIICQARGLSQRPAADMRDMLPAAALVHECYDHAGEAASKAP